MFTPLFIPLLCSVDTEQGCDHVSKGGMVSLISEHWDMCGFSNYAKRNCEKCVICAVNNVGQGQKIPNAAPLEPFDHLMMDFVELSPCRGKQYCLVIIDMFSKWIEVFPTGKADAAAVVKALLMEIIPRWEIPRKFSSDRGTHFVKKVLEKVSKKLGIEMKFHCAHHP